MASLALHPHGTLTANLAAFCTLLRQEHGFTIGPGEEADALRAIELVGVADVQRVRMALCLVLCATQEQIAPFDDAFDTFFLPGPPRGARQHNLHARHTRPRHQPLHSSKPLSTAPQRRDTDGDNADRLDGAAQRRFPVPDDTEGQRVAPLMRARYSDVAGEAAAPAIPRDDLDIMLEATGILVRRLRLGRSRRWHAPPVGPRFDFRRTVRGSLQTGGEALRPRWQGHPHRNPRIVVVVDGSRSMSDYAGVMLQFAYAISQRTRRLDAFVFSTDLRDVTLQLRRMERGQRLQLADLADLAEAWGGGTRIGACLQSLIREFGHRCLSEHSLVFILSDGLDVGDPDRLRLALRELRRRSSGLIWLNPLMGTPGYSPTAQGMRAALPYLDVLTVANDAHAFKMLAQTLTTRTDR